MVDVNKEKQRFEDFTEKAANDANTFFGSIKVTKTNVAVACVIVAGLILFLVL